jgi:hypothetical protein
MGAKYSNVYHKHPDLQENECEFEALNLKESKVGELMRIYDQSICTTSKTFDVCKFLDTCNILPCGFAKYAVTYYATKRQTELQFRPFVFSLWNFCTLEGTALGN